MLPAGDNRKVVKGLLDFSEGSDDGHFESVPMPHNLPAHGRVYAFERNIGPISPATVSVFANYNCFLRRT